MADELLATAGSETPAQSTPPPVETDETPEAPEQRTARRSANRDAINARLKGMLRGTPRSDPTPAADAPSQADEKAPDADEAKPYTKAELERLIQSENDRREAKRNRDAAAQAKREAEVALRRNDPFQYAEFKEQEEAQQTQEAKTNAERLDLVQATTQQFDKLVLDPLFGALPKSEQDKILKDNGHLTGFESRAAITKAALASLQQHFRAEGAKEAEAQLRKNPAFRTQLMAELRGTREEPVVLSGTPKASRSLDINAWLRAKGT